MKFIKHRQNSILDLEYLKPNFGCEIDLRSDVKVGGSIHLAHDPWVIGDKFENWLMIYKNKNICGPIILNTKEDGLESRIIELLEKYEIRSYFFLDTSFPTFVKWTKTIGNRNFAIRISKYEDQNTAKKFIGHADWIWLDCFNAEIPSLDWISELRENFKICLVSPELQGANLETIKTFKQLKSGVDAICTKHPELWEQ